MANNIMAGIAASMSATGEGLFKLGPMLQADQDRADKAKAAAAVAKDYSAGGNVFLKHMAPKIDPSLPLKQTLGVNKDTPVTPVQYANEDEVKGAAKAVASVIKLKQDDDQFKGATLPGGISFDPSPLDEAQQLISEDITMGESKQAPAAKAAPAAKVTAPKAEPKNELSKLYAKVEKQGGGVSQQFLQKEVLKGPPKREDFKNEIADKLKGLYNDPEWINLSAEAQKQVRENYIAPMLDLAKMENTIKGQEIQDFNNVLTEWGRNARAATRAELSFAKEKGDKSEKDYIFRLMTASQAKMKRLDTFVSDYVSAKSPAKKQELINTHLQYMKTLPLNKVERGLNNLPFVEFQEKQILDINKINKLRNQYALEYNDAANLYRAKLGMSATPMEYDLPDEAGGTTPIQFESYEEKIPGLEE